MTALILFSILCLLCFFPSGKQLKCFSSMYVSAVSAALNHVLGSQPKLHITFWAAADLNALFWCQLCIWQRRLRKCDVLKSEVVNPSSEQNNMSPYHLKHFCRNKSDVWMFWELTSNRNLFHGILINILGLFIFGWAVFDCFLFEFLLLNIVRWLSQVKSNKSLGIYNIAESVSNNWD